MYRIIANMDRAWKRRILLLADLLVMVVSLRLATILRMGSMGAATPTRGWWLLCAVLVVSGLVLVLALDIHKIKLNAFGGRSLANLGALAVFSGYVGALANGVFHLGVARMVPVIYALVLFGLLAALHLGAREGLRWLRARNFKATPVAIFGAGAAGIQLLSALRESREIRPVAIVDDKSGLHGMVISGLTVQAPAVLDRLVAKGRVRRVLLAVPSASRARQAEIVAGLGHLGCEIQTLPGYSNLIESGGLVESLRPVLMEDLLPRPGVDIDLPAITQAYRGRVVLVTGAGGSIGGELCRQVLGARPKRLVLLEMSEPALYAIDREIRKLAPDGVEVATVLGSVTDRGLLARVMRDQGVDLVLHAAAYKHVPLIEEHVLEGVRNNVLGTRCLAEAALAAGVERFILVSTDKAVRPTNIMGATKRLAELVIQDLQTRSAKTRFAMVRFGNVLGSSGSVIPLFREQIANGGPVTLTHPEVTRYFMTIPEASRLVLLAGSFATGGDVFVLDMGKPVRIADMARRLIERLGLTVRDAKNPQGDIEIVTTGMRPGEKLYEELLIDADILPTPHEKILRASEGSLSEIEMAEALRGLERAVRDGNADAARRLVARWVKGYHRADYGVVA